MDYTTKDIRAQRACSASWSKERGINLCNALSVGKSVCDHMIYKGRIFGATD